MNESSREPTPAQDLIAALRVRDLSPSEWDSLADALDHSPSLRERYEEQLSSLDIFPTAASLLSDSSSAISVPRPEPLLDSIRGMNELARKLFPGAMSPEVLGRIDSFDLLEAIGSGGMGIVYKAFDRELHRFVAIKILSPSLCIHGSAKQRFVREAQAAAGIDSPYIVPIHAVSVANDIPFLVMTYVAGVDLQTHILQHGPLSLRDAIHVSYQVAQALLAAHQRSIVHRDIKPGNILLEPSTMRASLTDFGLARVCDETSLTLSGATAGTPSFMSPEQAKGEPVDTRSDWFSLGSVLFTMLTGKPPFLGPHAYAIVQQLLHCPAPNVSTLRDDAPEWLGNLLCGLMHRDRDQRIAGEAAVETLRLALLHIEHPAFHPVPKALQPKRKKNRWLPSRPAIAAMVTVLCAVCLWSLWGGNSDRGPVDSRGATTLRTVDDPPPNSASQSPIESRKEALASAPEPAIVPLPEWSDDLETKMSLQQIDAMLLELETLQTKEVP